MILVKIIQNNVFINDGQEKNMSENLKENIN
jgi:hypothetical protein